MKCSACLKEAIEGQIEVGNDVHLTITAKNIFNPLVTENAITTFNGNSVCYPHLLIQLGV